MEEKPQGPQTSAGGKKWSRLPSMPLGLITVFSDQWCGLIWNPRTSVWLWLIKNRKGYFVAESYHLIELGHESSPSIVPAPQLQAESLSLSQSRRTKVEYQLSHPSSLSKSEPSLPRGPAQTHRIDHLGKNTTLSSNSLLSPSPMANLQYWEIRIFFPSSF